MNNWPSRAKPAYALVDDPYGQGCGFPLGQGQAFDIVKSVVGVVLRDELSQSGS